MIHLILDHGHLYAGTPLLDLIVPLLLDQVKRNFTCFLRKNTIFNEVECADGTDDLLVAVDDVNNVSESFRVILRKHHRIERVIQLIFYVVQDLGGVDNRLLTTQFGVTITVFTIFIIILLLAVNLRYIRRVHRGALLLLVCDPVRAQQYQEQ